MTRILTHASTPKPSPRPARERKPIQKQSAKQRKRAEVWAETKPEGDYIACERCGKSVRRSESHGHHFRKRRFGDDTKRNRKDLCGECHDWVETHPFMAHILGFSYSAKVAAQLAMQEEK